MSLIEKKSAFLLKEAWTLSIYAYGNLLSPKFAKMCLRINLTVTKRWRFWYKILKILDNPFEVWDPPNLYAPE